MASDAQTAGLFRGTTAGLAPRWEDVDNAGRSLMIERAVSGGRVKATKTEETRVVDLTRGSPRLSAGCRQKLKLRP